MKKIISTGLILASIGGMHGAYAQSDELAQALQTVRTNCGGISAALDKMKTMAGINTAVTGVGTVSAPIKMLITPHSPQASISCKNIQVALSTRPFYNPIPPDHKA